MSRLGVLLSRPDFRADPAKSLLRRLIWRLRWRLTDEAWVLPLGEDLRIAVPKGGAGALIYYQGFSEPATADLIARFLKPGMVFLDIGAHIGEYVLLGARTVGADGEVHAFEPSPCTFRLLEENVRRNRLGNVLLHNVALAESDGARPFEVCTEPSLSSFQKEGDHSRQRRVTRVVQVLCMCLDTFVGGYERTVDLVKIDVEGAELLVFRGAEGVLRRPKEESPVWIFECEPQNYAEFGYKPADLFELLRRHGYELYEYDGNRCVSRLDSDTMPSNPHNLLAAKDEARLYSTIVSDLA